MAVGNFEAGLDAYQARLAEEATEAEERSWTVAARPDAVPAQVAFSDLRVGDYITNDGRRWARIIDLRGSSSYVRSKHPAVPDGHVSVLIEIPEPVTVSGETHYWIDRPASELVTVDAAGEARHG
jgi:hypothetical protein